jgi:ABC-type nitrate/sulfonate/bicarbonate transport system substrate-binding protein
MPHLDRSAFVRAGAGAAATALLGAGSRPDFGSLVVQLPWIKNVEWAGEYIADTRGYYRDAGFSSVSLLAGGIGGPPVEALVAAGRAFVAISSLADTASAVLQGADVTTIGVQYQTTPYIIASPAARPLRTPHDLIGKRIGVPAGNEFTWNAFLRVNALDASAITTIKVGSTPDALVAGQVDGLLAFVTNVPHELAARGYGVHVLRLGDFGYALANNNYIVAGDTLRTQRPAVKAFLHAAVRGWKDAVASPALGAGLAVNDYGRDLGLTLADQIEQSRVQDTLLQSPQTRAHGLFTMAPSETIRAVTLLRASGIAIEARRLFDLSPLDEVYAEHPTLR